MDHSDALRLKATEKYLLNELDPEQLDQFEEHMFDCRECAIDVRAAAMFVEQSKAVLSEVRGPVPLKVLSPARKGWLDWLRPAFAAPALALLLVVVGYQNLVSYPKLRQALSTPQVMAWTAVNVGTYGTEDKEVTVVPGKSFLLLVRIPPETGVNSYTADLYNPYGKLEWSLSIPLTSDKDHAQDRWPVQVPGANWTSGTYTLKVHGTTTTGEVRDLGQTSVDLKVQQ
jgi:hypothetical protein